MGPRSRSPYAATPIHPSLWGVRSLTRAPLDPGASRLRIYLATDEPRVIEEATTKYPQYIFLTTKQQGLASGEGERTGILHTENLLSDVYHLALCDFFVGTASSQVTRYVNVTRVT